MTIILTDCESSTSRPSALAHLKARLTEDHIDYLLVQFVDIHGSAKVKMVPADYLDDVVTEGAGFAGAALWGMGQGPHSHDMLGRADINTYTPLPWEPGVARLASDIYVDGRPHPYCPRVNLKRMLAAVGGHGLPAQRGHRAGILPGEARAGRRHRRRR